MSKVVMIGITEYLNAVRSKAFIIGIIMMPILMGGSIVVQVLAEKSTDLSERKFAVLDQSGDLYGELESAAEKRNAGIYGKVEEGSDEPAEQFRPRFEIERYVHPDDEPGSAELALSERVRSDELFAFVVIGEDVFETKRSTKNAVSYYSASPTYDDLPSWIETTIQKVIESSRFESASMDPKLIKDLTRPVRFKGRGLIEETEEGEEVGGKEDNKIQSFLIPTASMFLLFMLIMMSAPQALNVVLEEKMQKISEVLISAVTPFQLMMGKLMGTVMVSMTLSALYLGAILILTHYFEVSGLVPLRFYGWFLVFQLMALAIYTSLFAAIGAACSEMRDAQSLMTPMMLLVLLPMFFWSVVLKSPDSTLSAVISLFPPATPMLMMMRVAIPPGPPVWQLVLSVVLTAGFTVLCVWASGKVFRIGLLATGQAPTLRKLVGWVFSK